jgi:N-acetylglucosaminyl-diphospho-decaprenol L-rhamnosyltransferase
MTCQMSETFTFSIISHGHGGMLHSLLDDIAAFPDALQYKLVVTLNLASEELDPQQWPTLCIQVICNDVPKGFGANHNQAFKYCTTSWFVVLNPDLKMPMDPMPKLMDAAHRRGSIGAVTPAVVNESGHAEDHVRRNLTPWALWRRYRGDRVERVDVSHTASLKNGFYWLAGMFLAFPAHAYRQVNGFDERFFLYCEDYDICARLVLADWQLLKVSDAQVIHAAQRDSHRSKQHLSWHLQSLVKVWSSAAYWRLLASMAHKLK